MTSATAITRSKLIGVSSVQRARELVQKLSDDDVKSINITTDLIMNGRFEINYHAVLALLESGRLGDAVNKTDQMEWTILHLAARDGRADICERVIKDGGFVPALGYAAVPVVAASGELTPTQNQNQDETDYSPSQKKRWIKKLLWKSATFGCNAVGLGLVSPRAIAEREGHSDLVDFLKPREKKTRIELLMNMNRADKEEAQRIAKELWKDEEFRRRNFLSLWHDEYEIVTLADGVH